MKWIHALGIIAALVVIGAATFLPYHIALTVMLWTLVVELWTLTIVYAALVRFERSTLGRAFIATNTSVAILATWISANRSGILTWHHYERFAIVAVAAFMVSHVWLHVTMVRIQKRGNRNGDKHV